MANLRLVVFQRGAEEYLNQIKKLIGNVNLSQDSEEVTKAYEAKKYKEI